MSIELAGIEVRLVGFPVERDRVVIPQGGRDCDRFGRRQHALDPKLEAAPGELLFEELLETSVAQRNVAVLQHRQSLAIDPCDRGLAVEDGGQHGQVVALAGRAQHQARFDGGASWKLDVGDDVQRSAQLGQPVADQRAQVALVKDLAATHGVVLARREAVFADRSQRVAALRGSVVEHRGQPGVLLES